MNLIVELEFTGRGLLTITEDELIRYGMNKGPARTVVCRIKDLKLAKGLRESGLVQDYQINRHNQIIVELPVSNTHSILTIRIC